MEVWKAIVLGIIQGLTEFLPVSSSGHLVLFQQLLGLSTHNLTFDIAVHVGTLLSVLTIYIHLIRRVLTHVAKKPTDFKSVEWNLVLKILVASVPTGIMGIFLKDFFEDLFSNMVAVSICFMITGTILFLTRKIGQKDFGSVDNIEPVKDISYFKAFLLGVAQGVAIAPGISRAGSTIAAGIFLGLPRNTAAMFSFMMSLPAIMGAALLQARHVQTLSEGDLLILLLGGGTAYLAGLAGLSAVLHFVRQGRLEVFSYYLWILGALSLAWSLT